MCRLKEYPPEVKKTLEHSGEVSYIGKRLDDGSIEKDRAQSELNVRESHFEKVKGGLHDKIKGLSEAFYFLQQKHCAHYHQKL